MRFKVIGLQGVSTVSEAALADMANLVDFIKKQSVKAIFVETSVNPAAIRRVAECRREGRRRTLFRRNGEPRRNARRLRHG